MSQPNLENSSFRLSSQFYLCCIVPKIKAIQHANKFLKWQYVLKKINTWTRIVMSKECGGLLAGIILNSIFHPSTNQAQHASLQIRAIF